MCVEFLRYKACSHERRHFLKKCRFVRKVGCFEPAYAYFFGPTGSSPCQFPKTPGEVHYVEGWCSPWCKDKYEVLGPRKFKGRTPSVYMRERVAEITMAAGSRSKSQWSQRTAVEMVGARHGYGVKMEREYEDPTAAPPLDRHERKAYQKADEEVTEPQGVPLEWPFRGHQNREQMAPALDVGPRPNRTPSQQKKDGNADKPKRDHRSNRASAKPQSECSERAPASPSRKEGSRRPVSEMSFGGTESGYSERSSTVARPVSDMYRQIVVPEGSGTEEGRKKGKKSKKAEKKVEKKKSKGSKLYL